MVGLPERLEVADDSLTTWSECYLDPAVRGVRSAEVTGKLARHLGRFRAWIIDGLERDQLSAVTVREVTV
ncbi:hypothetical protein [Streptosporangium sp. NPDC000396]|uniref:hypothetical protein n=1 Tax=Streptosporangium sp. NPDC000396 TaxID=3366185 RepID=UPI0036A70E66